MWHESVIHTSIELTWNMIGYKLEQSISEWIIRIRINHANKVKSEERKLAIIE